MTPDPQTGVLGEWAPVEGLTLPEARAGSAAVSAPTGLLLIGGQGPDGPVATTYQSVFDAQGALGEWAPVASLQRPQADALGAVVGDFVWLYGGRDAAGPVGAVQRGRFGTEAPEGQPDNPDEGKVIGWDISNDVNLPGAPDNTAGRSAHRAQ
jgi:hypothetical protein